MIYLLFAILCILGFLINREITKQNDYILLAFTLVFFYLEFSVLANYDVYSKLMFKEVKNCSVDTSNNSICTTYYDLDIDRTEKNFTVSTFYYLKQFDNALFDVSGVIFFGTIALLVIYILYKALLSFNML
jgi:hypothetical protein